MSKATLGSSTPKDPVDYLQSSVLRGELEGLSDFKLNLECLVEDAGSSGFCLRFMPLCGTLESERKVQRASGTIQQYSTAKLSSSVKY